MDLPIFFYGAPLLFDRIMEQDGDIVFPMVQAFDLRQFPPLQIFEDEETLHVRACIPGASLSDLSLTLKGNLLLIEGAIPFPEGECLRQERVRGPFKREVRLPCDVGNAETEAVMRDGLLTVTLPKNTKKSRKRTIPVESALKASERRKK